MQYIYKFDLNELITIDTYIDYIELYLKNNKILKKDFFVKTDICANSYRFFLTHREKNRKPYYKIISKSYGMYIPNEVEMEELSVQYSKIVEDILYHRNETYEENLAIIQNVLTRNNPKGLDKVSSIEEVLFRMLEVILKLSLNQVSPVERKKLLTNYMNKVKPYASLIKGIYSLLYQMTVIYYNGFVLNTIAYADIDTAMEKTKNYTFLQPLLYSVLSDVYFNCKEYSNSVLACNHAYDGYIEVYNFRCAVLAKIRSADIYMHMDTYYYAYQILSKLALSFETYPIEQKAMIIRGLADAYLLLERYEDVIKYVDNNKHCATVDMEIDKLFAFCKLKRINDFVEAKNEFLSKYSDESYAGYHIIVENIHNLMKKERLQLKKREPFTTMINSADKKILHKICKKMFNKNKFR